ncbi:uncharacterized protein LOC131237797 [Magnolia sinica]|uniref:uncharacterized protein LOC131237797 n=1 Tax=Magnolia sinica TaxID=86752 RepID=UPI00265A9293|nr:uncharacterized protein LOC131237797 [Magnolia sinica]
MELSSIHFYQSLKRYWHRRNYQRLEGTCKRHVRVSRLGGSSKKRRFWKIRTIPKLRLKLKLPSPIKIAAWLRDAYVEAMLALQGSTGYLHSGGDGFGGKRIPRGRVAKASARDFENRMMFEIYKSILDSRELSTL